MNEFMFIYIHLDSADLGILRPEERKAIHNQPIHSLYHHSSFIIIHQVVNHDCLSPVTL